MFKFCSIWIISATALVPGLARAQCNETLTAESPDSGVVRSPGYFNPAGYNRNMSCRWSFPNKAESAFLVVMDIKHIRLYYYDRHNKPIRTGNLTIQNDIVPWYPGEPRCYTYRTSELCKQLESRRFSDCNSSNVAKFPLPMVFSSNDERSKTSLGGKFAIRYRYVKCRGNEHSNAVSTTAPPEKMETTETTTVNNLLITTIQSTSNADYHKITTNAIGITTSLSKAITTLEVTEDNGKTTGQTSKYTSTGMTELQSTAPSLPASSSSITSNAITYAATMSKERPETESTLKEFRTADPTTMETETNVSHGSIITLGCLTIVVLLGLISVCFLRLRSPRKNIKAAFDFVGKRNRSRSSSLEYDVAYKVQVDAESSSQRIQIGPTNTTSLPDHPSETYAMASDARSQTIDSKSQFLKESKQTGNSPIGVREFNQYKNPTHDYCQVDDDISEFINVDNAAYVNVIATDIESNDQKNMHLDKVHGTKASSGTNSEKESTQNENYHKQCEKEEFDAFLIKIVDDADPAKFDDKMIKGSQNEEVRKETHGDEKENVKN